MLWATISRIVRAIGNANLALIILGALATVLIIIGLFEFKFHQISLSEIPKGYRHHVQGKSSVTRLIAAGLRAGGKRTFAKTTGTAPRVIDSEGIDRIITDYVNHQLVSK